MAEHLQADGQRDTGSQERGGRHGNSPEQERRDGKQHQERQHADTEHGKRHQEGFKRSIDAKRLDQQKSDRDILQHCVHDEAGRNAVCIERKDHDRYDRI